jgi:transcriptional regulator with XRE-family HTH domain
MPDEPAITLSQDLAEQLRRSLIERRTQAGLTQAVVADRLGITTGSYGHYERGFRRVPVSMIPQLTEALGCTESDLLGIAQPRTKRGPASGWEKRVEAIKALPKDKQRALQQVVDTFLAASAA